MSSRPPTRCSCASATSVAIRARASSSTGFPNLGVQDRRRQLDDGRRQLERNSRRRRVQRAARRLTTGIAATARASTTPRPWRRSWACSSRKRRPGCAGSRRSRSRGRTRSGRSPTRRRTRIATPGRSSTTISDTLTLVKGRQSLSSAGSTPANHAVDGFSLGVTGAAGAYTFGGASTGNSFGDFLLGLPLRQRRGDQHPRHVLRSTPTANEFGFFAQDDWKVSDALTIFAGVRYEYLGNFVEKHNLLINFDPATASLVLPDPSIAQYLSPAGARDGPQETAAEAGVGPSLVNSDANNVSPRVGFAWRVSKSTRHPRGHRAVLSDRGGPGHPRRVVALAVPLWHPPRPSRRSRKALTTGTVSPRSFFGVNAVDLNLQSPQVLQYNVTYEQELAGDCRRAGQLHRQRDAQAAGQSRPQHDAGEHDSPSTSTIPPITPAAVSESRSVPQRGAERRRRLVPGAADRGHPPVPQGMSFEARLYARGVPKARRRISATPVSAWCSTTHTTSSRIAGPTRRCRATASS